MSTTVQNTPKRSRYRIDAMDCPTEEALIRKKLGAMPGIEGLEFNLVQRVLTVNHTLESPLPLESAIRSLGFEPVVHDSKATPKPLPAPGAAVWNRVFLGIAGLAALGAEITELAGLSGTIIPAVLALAAVALGGWTTCKKGIVSLLNRQLNINALMLIAVTGALILGQWPEAAMVLVLFALAEKIEALSLDRARKSIQGLLDLSPPKATILTPEGSWVVVDAANIPLGTLVRVAPGERFSHDGVVSRGQSSVDQSPITGESIPVDKGPGSAVFAGTINQQGELQFHVTAKTGDSTLSRIIHLVENAQGSRSRTQLFVDRFARIYTPLVVAGAVLLAVLPPVFFGGDWSDWVYKALVMLVIACPCALVISTPVSIVSALASAARMGIVIKGGVHLEAAGTLQWVAFDKTGTITRGCPSQSDYIVLEDTSIPLGQIARALAGRSEHPVSRAIAAHPSTDSLPLPEAVDFTELPGRGIQGRIEGELWYLGNHRLMEELGLCTPVLEQKLLALEEAGKTGVVLANTRKVMAIFGVMDSIKPASRDAVTMLHTLGIKTLMLSGDREGTALAVGKLAGIDEVRGEQLPQDKARSIKALVDQGQRIAMVGDGINDAPALAHASLGIAMGSKGSDTAIETADVVLMDDDPGKIPRLIGLSRRTQTILVQNMVCALGIKLVFLVLTALGLGTMWMAVFADMGASLLVVLNGLRLLGGTRTQLGSECNFSISGMMGF